MKIEHLKSLITDAFKDVPYPGDDRIAGCSRIGCDDCDVIPEHFKGTTWQEHNPPSLTGFDAAISFFYPEALRYYLPAFLIATLDDSSGDCLPNVYESLESIHWPWGGASEQARAKDHVSRLSILQRTAVAEYFKYSGTDGGKYDLDQRTQEIVGFLLGNST